jgi:hypothetical protein
LNPGSAADRNSDFDNDGYTNLEEYLNEIGAFKAVRNIVWTGAASHRYACIGNWDIPFQPSRLDTAIIDSATVAVDALGQHAGTLILTNHATLNITRGWLDIADRFEIRADATACLLTSGGLRVTNDLVNAGTLVLVGDASLTVGGTFTNTGTLDLITWNGSLPAGFVNLGTVLNRGQVVPASSDASGTNVTGAMHGYDKHTYQAHSRNDLPVGSW